MAGKERCRRSCWENLNEEDHLELLGVLVEYNIKMELKMVRMGEGSGLD
jgi:hypothetical protein